MKGLYTQRPDIAEREMGNEAFLANPENDAIYYLNATGVAVWRLLSKPTTVRSAVEILQKIFPEVEREQLEADVVSLVADLLEHGLLTEAG